MLRPGFRGVCGFHSPDLLLPWSNVPAATDRATGSTHDLLPPGGLPGQFLEADTRTPLPRSFTFKDPDKIRELARRGEALRTSEARQLLDYAIEQGRGGIVLDLTPEQYRKLHS
jgi:hypothetical protein